MQSIQKAIDYFGSQAKLAARLQITQPTISEWVRGERPIPPERCPDIERGTDGAVPCEDLRPDIRWHRIKDSTWPHPKGRPLIDVASPA